MQYAMFFLCSSLSLFKKPTDFPLVFDPVAEVRNPLPLSPRPLQGRRKEEEGRENKIRARAEDGHRIAKSKWTKKKRAPRRLHSAGGAIASVDFVLY